MKQKIWFFEKINKINKSLIRPTKKKKKTHLANISNKTENLNTDPADIKRTVMEHYKQLYAHKLDNLDEMDSFKSTNYHNSSNMKPIIWIVSTIKTIKK